MAFIDRDSLREISATLARNKTRTFLTAFGIFWGTLMLSLLWGSGQGARRMLYSNFEGISSNTVGIITRRTTMPYKGYKKGMAWEITTSDIINLKRQLPEVDIVTPILNRYTTIKCRQGNSSVSEQRSVYSVDQSYLPATNPKVTQGRFINDVDVAKGSKVCVIGENLAKILFKGANPLGQSVEAAGYNFRIVGVAKQINEANIGGDRVDNSLFIPLSTGIRAFNTGDNVDFVIMIVKDEYKPSTLRDKIYHVLRRNHPLHPDDTNAMEFIDLSELFEKIGQVFGGLDLLLLFVGFSSLLAGIIGVGNIMWIIVKERTKEFGIRRAIGAKPMSIMSQILTESALLTVVAGMAAIVVSVGILAVATSALKNGGMNLPPEAINFQLSFGSAIAILLLFIVLGSAAGTIPAIKAMRIKPIEALNDK